MSLELVNHTLDTTLIVLPKEFRNKIWGEQFGRIQEGIRNDRKKNQLIIDSLKCEWSDPLPFLSLLITIIENKKKYNEIVFNLPSVDSIKSEQKKFLAFLYKEGFLNVLLDNEVNVIVRSATAKKKLDEDYCNIIGTYEKELSFIDSTIFKATVLDLKTMNEEGISVDDYVKNNLIKINHRLRNKIKSANVNIVYNRIVLFLKETIENVNEHAYDDNSKQKLVGFYIRYRLGLNNNNISREYEVRLRQAYNKENKKSPRLEKSFAEQKIGFIEIFVIDAGVGITENFYFGKKKKKFRNAWREIVGLGVRSNHSRVKKLTNFGGLYSLSRICQGNYLLARDNNEWIGDKLPIVGNTIEFDANKSYIDINSRINIAGLALIARISWNEASDNQGDWSRFDTNKNSDCIASYLEALSESKDVYTKYYNNHFNALTEKPFFVIDDRMDLGELNLDNDYLKNFKATEFAFYLPLEGDTKNNIHSKIVNKYCSLDSGINSIVIGDIPVWEASVYQFALENAKYTNQFLEKINRIVLITKRLTVLILEKNKSNTYTSNSEKSNQFRMSINDRGFRPDHSLKNFLEWIKTHDSMLFWQYVKKENVNNEYFLYENIDWYQGNKDIGLVGYLNFAKTLTDSFCTTMYENVIERTLFLANENGCNYESIDILTSRISAQLNSRFYNVLTDNHIKILLGSVYVSGYSEKSREIKTITEISDYKIHFFHNQSVKNVELKSRIFQLLLWPVKGENWFKENINVQTESIGYQRVGSSHVIAPGGWKYFPIPRYKTYDTKKKIFIDDTDNIDIENIIHKSVYQQNPKNTYEDWQGKNGPIIGLGHIDYENNHDLFKIDIPFIVKESFLMGTEISQFILGEFLYALGGIEQDLIDKNNSRLINGVKQYLNNEYGNIKDSKSIIVYPYHYNNEFIISLIKNNISEKFHNRFFAFFPLNKERSTSSFLTSPLTIEALKKRVKNLIANETDKVEAILFDDAIVSGKTRKELEHLLYTIGISKVKAITIIERRRLPFSTSNPNYSKAFWRLDVPKLGNSENCYICSSLKQLEDFKSNVISNNVIERINYIKNYWAARSPYDMEYDKLPPYRINKDSTPIHKKFGIFYDDESKSFLQCGGDDNKIELFNSLGLTIYCSELHTMTSTDKTVLKYAKDPKINIQTKIELISSYIILFANEINTVIKEELVILLFNFTRLFEQNVYSSLALIALINQNRNELEILYKEAKDDLQSEISITNFDMLILTSYLASYDNSKFKKSKKAVRLLKKYKILKDLYKQFHSEIYNDYGAIHDTPLQLMNKGEYIGDDKIVYQAQDSCDKLIFLIKEISHWQSRQNQKEYEQNISALILQINDFKNKINSIENTRKYLSNIQKILNAIFSNLKLLHFGFFAPLGKNKNNLTFRDHILEILNGYELMKDKNGIAIKYGDYIKISKKFIDLEEDLIKKWIIFDKNIKNFIHQVLANVRHSLKKIKDPYNESDSELSFGWLNIEYCNDRVELILTNSSKKNNLEIEKEMKTKTKQARIDAKQLGSTLELSSENHVDCTILKTKIIIPLI